MWFKKFYTQLIFVLRHSKLDLQRHHLEVNGWNMLCSIQLRVPTIALVKNSFYISSDQSALQSNQSLLTQFSRFFLINANTPRFLIIKPTQNHVVSAMQIFSFQLRSLRRLYSSLSLHQNYLSFWLERGAWRLISRYMFGFNQPVVRMAPADNRSPNLNTGGSGTRDSK